MNFKVGQIVRINSMRIPSYPSNGEIVTIKSIGSLIEVCSEKRLYNFDTEEGSYLGKFHHDELEEIHRNPKERYKAIEVELNSISL